MKTDRPKTASWIRKFRNAYRGLVFGVRGQTSFFVHTLMAGAVVVCAALFRCSLIEWCLLLLCVTVVLVAEMFNSALERLAKAITRDQHVHLGRALDIASAAVLLASLGAAVVGAIVFLHRLAVLLGWAS